MDSHLINPDLIKVTKPGLAAWAMAGVTAAALVACLVRDVNRIQADIQSSVTSQVASAFGVQQSTLPLNQAVNQAGNQSANLAIPGNTVQVNVDGRDVTLTGMINSRGEAGANRDAMVDQLRQIDGVRVVVDDMTAFDPLERTRTEQLRFQDALSQIDAAAVVFEPNSTTLSLSSESVLLKVASLLKSTPQSSLKIAGHTDNSGNAERNLELSRIRANAVADFLVARGVNRQQLVVQGFGQTRPLFDNTTAEGRAKNRRIEFIHLK